MLASLLTVAIVVGGSILLSWPLGRYMAALFSGRFASADGTFAKLGGATLEGKTLDGKDIWSALTSGKASPRTEFLVNHDPCSGHGSCSGIEWSYRSGDMKLS